MNLLSMMLIFLFNLSAIAFKMYDASQLLSEAFVFQGLVYHFFRKIIGFHLLFLSLSLDLIYYFLPLIY